MKSSSNWSTTTSASACRRRHRPTSRTATSGSLEPHELLQRLGVAATAPGRAPARAQANGRRPGVAVHAPPARRTRRDEPRPHERRLAHPRGPDQARAASCRCSFSHSAATSASRPKKLSRCSSVNGAQPRVRARLRNTGARRRKGSQGRPRDRLQREGQIVGRVEAVLGPLLQAAQHHPLERLREPEAVQGQRFLPQDRRLGLHPGLPPERVPARHHLVEQDPEREDVRAVVAPPTPHLLGGHVAHRPEARALARHRRRRRLLGIQALPSGQAEVQDLDPPVRGQEDVRGLEVAVRDRLRVGGGEAMGHVHRGLDRLPQRQGALAQPLAQRLAFEQLRDDVGATAVGPHVVDDDHVRVGEGGDGSRLPLESAEAVPIAGDVVGEDLDRHVATEPRVARAVDLTHPPGPDEVEDLVRSQPCSGREGQGLTSRCRSMIRSAPPDSMSRLNQDATGRLASPFTPGTPPAPGH